MSNEPPTADPTEDDAPDGSVTSLSSIGLTGSVDLGRSAVALGGNAKDAGIQRPPSMEKPEETDLPKVSAPPFTVPPADEDKAEEDSDEPTQAPVDLSENAESAETDEATRPPNTTMRFGTPHELYVNFPEVKALTLHRPREGESAGDYIVRLRGSTTPEEAITFTAFAAQPAMAVWWAYGCLRTMADTLSPEDRGLMEMIAMWSGNPDNTNRWRVMKSALYAPKLTPVGYLGLAVGWSGGSVAPNDPAPVPAWRTPKAINTAVLSSVAHISLQERSRSLARFIDLAGKMFEV